MAYFERKKKKKTEGILKDKETIKFKFFLHISIEKTIKNMYNCLMKKFLICVFFLSLGAGLAALESLIAWGKPFYMMGKTLTPQQLEFPIIVKDRNGIEIYRNFNKENREWIKLKDFPQTIKTATIIAEDKRFYSHYGIDPKGILRAIIANHKDGGISQGASTITQQIARKIFLTDEKSYVRKLKEMFVAFGIESAKTKDEILEMYLNTVPYGARINGVEVAAKVYFHKKAHELTDAESFILAVLPQNPIRLSRDGTVADWLGKCPVDFIDGTCSPFKDLNYDFSRLESILFSVAKMQNWSPEKTQNIWNEIKKVKLPQTQDWVQEDFQHFRFYIQDFLTQHDFDYQSAKGGLIITTTLDSELQKDIYAQLRQESQWLDSQHWISNFASIILDHESRGPLVWIGSKDYWNDEVSGRVDMLRSRRQTGSTIKPFIYSAAIEAGYQPPTVFHDSSLNFRGENGRVLRNSDGNFEGGIRMSQALAHSRNIPAAEALLLGGGETLVRKFLDRQFGFDINKHYKGHYFGWTLALGTAPLKIMDLANAYATIGSNKYDKICPILEITDSLGNKLENPCQIRITRSRNKITNFFISEILSDISNRPPDWSKLVTPAKNMAIKTGTSSKRVDGVLMPADDYVIGYTPKTTLLLWGGNTDGRALKPGSVSIFSIGPTWKRLAHILLKHHPELFTEFKRPENLQKIYGEWATLDYKPPTYNLRKH